MEQAHRTHYRGRRGIMELWLGALAAPLAWTVQLQVVYSATPYLCASGSMLLPYAVSLGAALLAGLGVFLSYKSWNAVGRARASDGPGVVGRTRLFALVGMGASAFFLIVILVQSLPLFLLEPCP